MKTKLFSVTIHDCQVDTFTVGGHGGSGKDTSNTGVRVTHVPSGAIGRSTESRRQSENKRTAFKRTALSEEFRRWVNIMASETRNIEAEVDEAMDPKNLKVEVRNQDGK